MPDMKDDFNDNELDRAFRQGIEPMEMEPSASFWQKAESDILAKENFSFRKKLFQWKAAASVLSVVVVSGAFYIFHLQNKLSVKEKEMTVAVASPHKEISNEAKNKIVQTVSENKFIPLPASETKHQAEAKKVFASNETNQQKSFIASKNNPSMISADNNVAVPSEEKNNIKEYFAGAKPSIPPLRQDENISEQQTPLAKINSTGEVIEKPKVDSSANMTSLLNANLPAESVALPQELPSVNFLSKISISGFFSSSIANQFLKDNNADDNIEEDDVNESEEDQFSYSAGIKMGYDLKDNWSVQTGCNYSVSSFNINPTLLYAKPGTGGDISYSLVTSSGVVEIPSDASTPVGDTLAIAKNSSQTLSFINIPLQLSYNYPVKRFIFYASAGASANILVDSQTDVNYEDDISGEDEGEDRFDNIEGLKQVHCGFSFGIGAKYMLTRKFFLSAEPSFSGALTPINKNVPIQSHPYFWGLGLGIGFHF